MELYEVMARKGVQGPSTSLKCDEDGSYAGMQCSGNVCRCYDKYLNIIGGLTKTGCQCSRDIWMNDQLNIAAGISCEVDSGSYAEVQTRSTYAFCVDEDGVRAGPLVHETVAENLACGAARLCQEGEDINCDKVCIGCTRDDYVN
ncbi:uncharacterized protein LOC122249906 [Penaeus japonicus]|uniref:uncharacterized protein LOC122249906 n=1 Tax=Penaeus japonicus TaxID=27405 RepID=UPI001C716226|nr:uncharacterized protein LOC122249906 [Penaeus japonicus]